MSAPSVTGAGARLRELYEQEWAWRVRELGDQSMGVAGPVESFLPDVSADAQQQREQRWQAVLDAVTAIPREELTPTEQVDLDVYSDQLRTLLTRQRFRMYTRPVNADSSFWSDLAMRSARRQLETEEDVRAYLDQLAQIPRYFRQQTQNMRAGLARGFAPPRVTMAGREAPVRTVAQATDPADVPYLAPLATLPASIPEATRRTLAAEAERLVRDAVVPAYGELLAFLTEEYLPALPEAIAAHDQPDGEAFYAAQLREFTTTDLTPQEIFDIGTAEVAAIRAEMAEVAAEVGFAGDVDGLLAHMRTDPRFYATTPRGLLAEAAYVCKKFDGVVHRYFGRLPTQRFGIEEPPADVAPYYTFGRGAPDRYILNTYNLPARPLYSLPALTLHESAPGHSFQTSLALELDQPDFRRQIYISAYGEGWALYCERLGVEMGIYETPYEHMGMLSFQMWRAARLVVDPGMHALGWSRERAQDFLRRNTAIAEHEIVTEIDRYIAWPGQAAAYYLGQLTIQRLRREAEETLGERFSLRDFHDAVLGLGSVPLDVLEAEIGRHVAARAAGSGARGGHAGGR
ncbi:DUF885 domain-containing protein [Georgenia alba]|uniref:DUF885 domain-containing protein n=1 Tax=Georgenia alba TaxID=2233858 RepID=A0ABW2QHZ2_9MICO